LVAHVVKDSPAYRGGVRDGDILLKVGLRNVTLWRIDPSILPLSRFWNQPAGTKVKLTLKRNDQQYETTVTLEELPAVD
jgi:C-terminal processing protease CtpA/Prc